ncbi:DnaA regulatory inactivator Hda [Motiliproteus sp. MSK22-1]|uniref:DnaA regulatory inactivator Hda n=1 Tax=Motiliproteus sp. MSK22-1 TaxID=1897630 RepID=UPI0009760EF2|nr:DnaA regulatory inactivator Hda [Motiliproteus sp. MSK22-1]OMH25885.1 DnaA regulatory inactivator Hda [Motiliproteus sp. MSK22-1]
MISNNPHQIPLSVGLRDDATFENFLTYQNLQAKQLLENISGGLTEQDNQYVYLWGISGSGCSHLLQAACNRIEEQGGQGFYLPLDGLMAYGPEVLDGLEGMALVCLDHIQAVAGDPAWEQALFHLYNRLRDNGRILVVAGNQPPRQLDIKLEDLSSRLSWGLVFQIKGLDDDAKMEALRLRARGRGIELTDEVLLFILHRSPRNMGQLFAILDRLDQASLTAKRKVTIPFIKHTLGW